MEENIHTQVLNSFTGDEVVTNIIDSTVKHSSNVIALEADLEKFKVCLNEYQEQPHLLDPFLEGYVSRLLSIVKDKETPKSAFHQSFKYLYFISKVRGYKSVMRLFSHEVADLEVIMKMLSDQSITDFESWETRYILLLWLAIVCMIPFDMSRLDGKIKDENQLIVNRVINTAKAFLGVSDKSRDAAAYLLSRFLTRPDLKGSKIGDFINWSLECLKFSNVTTMTGVNAITGALTTLALIFKHGRRDELLDFAPLVLDTIEECKINEVQNTLVRKISIKVVQRVGLIFLKPRVTSWRYSRGTRSLTENLTASATNKESNKQDLINNTDESNQDPESEDFDIPEEVETVIGILLVALEDTDTIVRWSAAKGIGRITGRLPLELADEVVEAMHSCFFYREQDCAWHGGCLALAELGRRGLLLPKHLPEVVPIILQALLYDERRGSYSVGSHVRDSACYVCWSFARAYHPNQIKPFVQKIANALLTVTVFDREVNCRRAASAAFQENVGRQGMFAHGIDILTKADYFAVGNRHHCFTQLSVFIGGFEEYTQTLVDHLSIIKVSHWDSAIRELTSHGLFHLTKTDPTYIEEKVLPRLLEHTLSTDVCAKHGGLLALGEVLHSLHIVHCQEKQEGYKIGHQTIEHIKKLLVDMEKGKELRGYGGEMLRKGCCKLIEKMALSNISVDESEVLDACWRIITTTIPHTELPVQGYALEALPSFCQQYVHGSSYFDQDKLLNELLIQLKSNLKFNRMGFAKAIGTLPTFMLKTMLKEVLQGLMECALVENVDSVDAGPFAESRREAVHSMLKVIQTTGVDDKSQLSDVLDCLFQCTDDYTIDSRGDVGAWVREQAMSSIVQIVCHFNKTHDEYFKMHNTHVKILKVVFQQLCEKIDRVRVKAGQLLYQLLYFKKDMGALPCIEQLREILSKSKEETINWAVPNEAFAIIEKLLSIKPYQYSLILGISISAGGITESLARHATDCVLNFLGENQESIEEMDRISEHFLNILKTHNKNDRVIVPLLKLLERLFSSGCFDVYLDSDTDSLSDFPQKLLTLVKEECKGCGDIKKLLVVVNIFCCLVQFEGEVRTKSLQHLFMFLCHKYPRVRRVTAEQLYTTFLTYDDIVCEDEQENVMNILTDVSWDQNIEMVRPERNKLCEIFGLPIPKLKKVTKQSSATPVKKDELDSYKDLVSRLQGY